MTSAITPNAVTFNVKMRLFMCGNVPSASLASPFGPSHQCSLSGSNDVSIGLLSTRTQSDVAATLADAELAAAQYLKELALLNVPCGLRWMKR